MRELQDWKQLMKDVREALLAHAWMLYTVVGIAAVLALGTVATCTVAHMRTDEPTGPAATSGAADGDEAGETPAEPDDSDAEPTDEQRRAIDSYGEAERTLVTTLGQAGWATASGAKVTFGERDYTDTDNSRHAYAITGVKVGEPQTETLTDNVEVTVTMQDTVFSLLDTGGRTWLCTYSVTQSNGMTVRTIKDGPFASGQVISETNTGNELEVDVPDELAAQVGGKADALTSAIRRWAGESAPAATKATWDQSWRVDAQAGTTTIGFTLNDSASTKLTVTYHAKDGSFEAKAASGADGEAM